jgi:hypothetical protein
MPAAAAGYSGKPLWQKLGLAAGQRLLAVAAPPHLNQLLAGAPAGVQRLPRVAQFDVALVFVVKESVLGKELARLQPHLADGGMIWVAWPKKTAGVATDITEDVVRAVALPMGIVDVKVCAIDVTWSGLKFLRRRTPARGG